MEEGFSGLLASIKKGSEFNYNPKDFTLKELGKLLTQPQPKREYTFFVNDYTVALMKNDRQEIDRIEKRMRVDRFKELKKLINKWGLFKAKVITWLNKKDRNASFMHPDSWSISDYGKWEYIGIGKGEMESVTLRVFLKEDKFKIVVSANDCDGYCDDVYRKTLAENVSFTSIINHINYISKRLEKNAY